MHMREGAENGLTYAYELIDTAVLGLGVSDLPDLLAAQEKRGLRGLNITHPFKQAVLPLLTTLSDGARAIGAVNTVVLRDGQRIGHNTDCSGFMESFRRGLPGADLHAVVQLGAGGAGAATAYGVLSLGARQLDIFDVDGSRAEALAAHMQAHFPDRVVRAGVDLESRLREAKGLVHATPTGMADYPGLPLPAAYLHPALWVAEVVYFPLKTALLEEARRQGCRTCDGGGMAVFQAVEAFRLFTGITPDAGRMLAHFQAMIRDSAA